MNLKILCIFFWDQLNKIDTKNSKTYRNKLWRNCFIFAFILQRVSYCIEYFLNAFFLREIFKNNLTQKHYGGIKPNSLKKVPRNNVPYRTYRERTLNVLRKYLGNYKRNLWKYEESTAYERHWKSQPMQIEAPIQFWDVTWLVSF